MCPLVKSVLIVMRMCLVVQPFHTMERVLKPKLASRKASNSTVNSSSTLRAFVIKAKRFSILTYVFDGRLPMDHRISF